MRSARLPDDLDVPFAVSTALALGVRPGQLRGPELIAPFFGIRSAPPPVDEDREASVRRRVDAFSVRMASSEFFCLVAASVLWGAPLPRHVFHDRDADGHRIERPLDVGVILPARAPRGRGVRGRSLIPRVAHTLQEPTTGHRVTSPATTWAMMGAVLGVEDLVALGDHFVREPMRSDDPPALTTIEKLKTAMDAGRRQGIANLREAVPQIRERSRSRQETRTRLALVGAGLPEPALNHPVVVDGTVVALIDLAYPELLLAFEYEGEHHLTDAEQWAKDIRRYEMLADLGWHVIRVTKGDLGSGRTAFLSRALAAHRVRR